MKSDRQRVPGAAQREPGSRVNGTTRRTKQLLGDPLRPERGTRGGLATGHGGRDRSWTLNSPDDWTDFDLGARSALGDGW